MINFGLEPVDSFDYSDEEVEGLFFSSEGKGTTQRQGLDERNKEPGRNNYMLYAYIAHHSLHTVKNNQRVVSRSATRSWTLARMRWTVAHSRASEMQTALSFSPRPRMDVYKIPKKPHLSQNLSRI